MINALPSVLEVRRLIECIGNGIDPRNDKRVRHDLDLKQIQIGLKYQFLIAGNSSEVAGKYRINNEPFENAYLTNIYNQRAVIFLSRRSKIKNAPFKGTCIPLKYEYEPWAQEVYEYVKNNPEPFTFVDNPGSSKRLFEAASDYVFQSIRFNNELYPGIQNYKAMRKGWGEFTNSCVNKTRIIDLKSYYKFDSANLLSFTSILNEHKEMNSHEPSESVNILKRIGESYFNRLCIHRYSYPPDI